MNGIGLRVAAIGALLLCGACGGDSGTGPGGGGGGGVAGEYELVGVNNSGVPAVLEVENCSAVRFVSGTLELEDGAWEMDVALELDTGADFLEDGGSFRRDGDLLEFESARYGDRFEGEIAGGAVWLYYDWCADGHHDVDFGFER